MNKLVELYWQWKYFPWTSDNETEYPDHFFFLETESHFAVHAVLKLVVLQLQSLKDRITDMCHYALFF